MSRKRSVQRPKTWLYLNVALALTLIVGGIALLLWGNQPSSGSNASASGQTTHHQGQPAPDFSLPSLAGETVSLDDYAGQVVLVNLWATWCPPCRAEMPTLNAFYETHQGQGFVVLAVNSQEDARTVEDFIVDNQFSFPVLLDSRNELLTRYQVRGLPTTFIIDRQGNIHYIHTGEITRQQLEAVVGPLL